MIKAGTVKIVRVDKGFIVYKGDKILSFNTVDELCDWLKSLEGI